MSQPDKIVGGVGIVRVGDLEITITPLTMIEERSLRRQLRKAAKDDATDYYTRCAKLLNAMRSQPVAYMRAVETITTLTATGPSVSDDQFAEYRESPAGVAYELFARGKKATPGIELPGLLAVVTVVNVDDVMDQMQRAIEGESPNASTP